MLEGTVLVLVVVLAWYWQDGMRTSEIAAGVARRACAAESVMLLDDTVAQVSVRLRRDAHGRVRLLRVYEFEFSDTGNNRLTGSVTLLGHELQTFFQIGRAHV